TLAIVADLSTPDFIHDLSEKTKELEIGLLVSNAGGYTYGSFHKTGIDQLSAFLRLNTNAHMQFAHYFGNKMKLRGRGGSILVSSTGVIWPMLYMGSCVE